MRSETTQCTPSGMNNMKTIVETVIEARAVNSSSVVLWKTGLGVAGTSMHPPVVGERIVYIVLSLTNVVAAVDRATGRILARTFLVEFCEGSLADVRDSRITLGIDDDAYFTAGTPCLYHIDTKTFQTTVGTATEPLYHSAVPTPSVIIAASTSTLFGFDRKTHELKWSAPMPLPIVPNKKSHNSIVSHGPVTLVMGAAAGSCALYFLNSATGGVFAKYEFAVCGDYYSVHPIGRTIAVVAGQSIVLLELSLSNPADPVKHVYTKSLAASPLTAVLARGQLFVGCGDTVTRVDVLAADHPSAVFSADIARDVVVAGGVVYGASRSGVVVAIDNETGRLWFRYRGDRVQAGANGILAIKANDTCTVDVVALPMALHPNEPPAFPAPPPPTGEVPPSTPFPVTTTPVPTPVPPLEPYNIPPPPLLEWATSPRFPYYIGLVGKTVVVTALRTLVAYDALDHGRVVWNFSLPGTPLSLNAVVRLRDTLFALSLRGLICVNITNGVALYTKAIGDDDYNTDLCAFPELNGIMVTGYNDEMYDARDGSKLWSLGIGPREDGMLVENVEAGYFAWLGATVTMRDFRSGTLIWKAPLCDDCPSYSKILDSYNPRDHTLWLCQRGYLSLYELDRRTVRNVSKTALCEYPHVPKLIEPCATSGCLLLQGGSREPNTLALISLPTLAICVASEFGAMGLRLDGRTRGHHLPSPSGFVPLRVQCQ